MTPLCENVTSDRKDNAVAVVAPAALWIFPGRPENSMQNFSPSPLFFLQRLQVALLFVFLARPANILCVCVWLTADAVTARILI